ncbi:hypothetical protein HJG60_009475 [Phyllostomus discolor]|uniref:Uncharacterized protein n=1 Tax=Phyllostomus discolor TaxID=89673 RepID=A0A833YJ65_9CHIR|nr:hypothetical protein HJG60_009475 [Phyllostomus discolor]
MECETFIEILILWKGEESYLKGDGNIFSIIRHISISVAHAGNPSVRAERMSPFSKLLWRPSVFPASPTAVGYIWWHCSRSSSASVMNILCPSFIIAVQLQSSPCPPLRSPALPPTSRLSANTFFAKDLEPRRAGVGPIGAVGRSWD